MRIFPEACDWEFIIDKASGRSLLLVRVKSADINSDKITVRHFIAWDVECPRNRLDLPEVEPIELKEFSAKVAIDMLAGAAVME